MTDANVEGNSSFTKVTTADASYWVQTIWDTVSTGAIKTCPRLYYLTIRCGWSPKGTNPHIFFGLLAHSAFETYEKAKAAGQDHEKALLAAVRSTLQKSGSYEDVAQCLNEKCGAFRPYIEEVPDDQLVCYACNGSAFRNRKGAFVPWQSDDKNKNRYNLLRTVVWYLDHYKSETDETLLHEDGTPAVEEWFRMELPITAPSGDHYFLTGHIDKIVRYNSQLRFRDLKTTKATINDRFFEKFSPNNQMSHYTVGGRVVFDEPLSGGIIDGAQVAVDFTRFQRGFVERTTAQLDEWLRDIQIWIKQAEQYAAQDYWPMNDESCDKYGGCRFRGICNKDPSIRQQFLKTHFEFRKWNPMEEREA